MNNNNSSWEPKTPPDFATTFSSYSLDTPSPPSTIASLITSHPSTTHQINTPSATSTINSQPSFHNLPTNNMFQDPWNQNNNRPLPAATRRNQYLEREEDRASSNGSAAGSEHGEENQSAPSSNHEQEQEREGAPEHEFGLDRQEDYIQIMRQLTLSINRMNQPHNNNGRESKLVDIPTFKGGEQDPLIWLNEFDEGCNANRISEQRRFEILPSYLKGIAHTWWTVINDRVNYWDDNTNRHESFVHLFQTKWYTSHQKSRWMNQLRQRMQKPGETVDEYYDAIIKLYQRVDPMNAYPREDKLRQFINGLRDELREPVEISCPIDLEDALNRAYAAESAYSKNSSLSTYSLRRNYLSQDNDELKDIKTAITQLSQGFQQLTTTQGNNRRFSNNNYNNNRSNNQRETRTCNNCGKIGHLSHDCRVRRNNNNNG